jgi:hypothetical protein
MEWERRSDGTSRAVVKNFIGKYKAILGRSKRARSLPGQRVEGRTGCRILNTVSLRSMPQARHPRDGFSTKATRSVGVAEEPTKAPLLRHVPT